jgi:hypothetical protein
MARTIKAAESRIVRMNQLKSLQYLFRIEYSHCGNILTFGNTVNHGHKEEEKYYHIES